MDLKAVLLTLVGKFNEKGVDYALIGGFAMGLWGVVRTTVDLDFLVQRDDLEKVEQIMEELEYDCLYRSENVSQYVSPLPVFGEVDFLHAFREASTGMLRNAVDKAVFEPGFSVRVLRPEDLVGLKLQALKNSPHRRRDVDDIRALISQCAEHLDRDKVARYVEILGAEDVYGEIIGGLDEPDA